MSREGVLKTIVRQRWSPLLVLTLCLPSASPAHMTHRPAPDTLAVIDNRAITSDRFARLFRGKVIRLGLTDNGDTRQGYLRNLVDDEILIAEAKRRKLDRTKESVAELARIQIQELLNAYSAAHISPNIGVTDEDMKELFIRMNTKVTVRHLYAQSRREADELFTEVSGGKSFEELARVVFTDPQLRDNGGSLGYIAFDEMDPAFENAAFALKVGEISKPVKTVEGYSIIRVDDIKRNPLVTENEFLKARDQLRRFVRKRKYEEAVTQFTEAQRSQLNPRFNDALMSRMFAAMHGGPHDAMNEAGLSPADLHQTVVATKTGNWDAGRVIAALKTSTESQRQWIRSEENLTDFIAGLIVREHIADMARKEGLDASPSYREQVTYAFDTFLSTTLENRLRKHISFSRDSLLSYYQHNAEKFRTPTHIRISAILLDTATFVDSVVQSLGRGVPFESLARRFSIQRLTADRGGDVGYYTEDQLEDLHKGISRIAVGQWAGPMVQEGKYLFVQCTGRKASVQKSFEESAPEITDILVGTSWPAARARWVESFKKTLVCRMYPERLMAVSLTP